MKKYLLFANTAYYPAGGAEDFINDFHSIEQAKANLSLNFDKSYYNWAQIADRDTMEVLWTWSNLLTEHYPDGIWKERIV